MLVIPAIDIRHGRCVRLLQGDPDRETVYSDDPVSVALRFQEDGARLIHVVDLDGAFEGRPVNRDLVAKIARAVEIPIEIGGGIRNVETARMYINSGIERIILGTVLLEPAGEEILRACAGYIVAGVDARDSMVSTHGWKSDSAIKAMDLVAEMHGKGVGEVIYTDISTDGMLTGPNIAAIRALLDGVPEVKIVASGGVSSLDDITALLSIDSKRLIGCIVGKAIYDGRVPLQEAVTMAGKRHDN